MTRRRILIIVGIVLLLPILAIAGVILVAQSEWGERWLEARVGKQLDREVQIEGISFRWGWPPGLIFARLRIGNPKWATTPNLIDAEGLYARVSVPPLLVGKVVIPYLGARKADAGLEMDEDRATWRFGNDSKEESRLVLMKVFLDDGHIIFRDQKEKTDLKIDAKGSAGEGGELRATATGTFRGESMKANARIPGLSPQHEAPLEIEGNATIGRTTASAAGTLTTDAQQLDLKIKLAGQTMKELSKVSGVVLPDSPPYNVNGRLRHQGVDWIFDPFDGKVGDSDVRGSLTYSKPQKAKPILKADIKAKLLDFDDLGPLIGSPPKTGPGESASPEQRAKAAEKKAEARLLPDQKFGVEAWAKMDADVKLVAEKIQRPKQLPLDAFSAHLVLRDSVMKLDPVNFGMAGGRITANVNLDGHAQPVKGTLKADIQGLKMGQLFPTSETMREALGTMYGRVELAGHGQSVAGLLGTSDGTASVAVDGGRVSALLLELVELDIANAVMLLGRKAQQEELRCAVGAFNVKGGVATADSFVVDTEDTQIKVDGAVNLANETMDIEAKPYAKHMSFVSLRTPIQLQGPLRKPHIHPKPGPIAARAAGAAGLAAINPALAVFALFEPARAKDSNCMQLLNEARKKGATKKTS